MKKRIVKALLAIVVSISFVGCNTIKTTDRMAETDSYIDMNTVISYSGTTNGLQLNFEDGTGYYLEIPQESDSLIEVSSGTVLDDAGNGQDICGYYIKYDSSRFSAGDQVQSVFVYNPGTNAIDDIVSRTDTLIQ